MVSRSTVVLASLSCMFVISCAAPSTVRLESEDAALTGLTVSAEVEGYSGTGYVTGFDQEADALTFTFDADAGLYEVRIGYGTPHGAKGYALTVNSLGSSGPLPAVESGFGVQSAGRFSLEDGRNTITVGRGWGWYDVDFIELVPAGAAPPSVPPATLADPDADASALGLYAYLRGLYGRKVLAGQYDFRHIDWVREQTGKEPAVWGFDLMDYSPSRIEHGADPRGLTERVIEAVHSGGGIVTLSWHWNAPTDLPNEEGREWWRGFYAHSTTFDLAAALADLSSEEYALLLRDIDAAAVELRKFADAGIPILWRPLHEAGGAWFWWGTSGPGPFVELWRLVFRRLVEHHGLHNLLWVYTPSGADGLGAWYPGDDWVDVVAPDVYTGPGDPMSGAWDSTQALFDGRKMLALGECGGPPAPDAPVTYGVWWSWFSVWGGMVRRAPVEQLRQVYLGEDVITRDELPGWLRGKGGEL